MEQPMEERKVKRLYHLLFFPNNIHDDDLFKLSYLLNKSSSFLYI